MSAQHSHTDYIVANLIGRVLLVGLLIGAAIASLAWWAFA